MYGHLILYFGDGKAFCFIWMYVCIIYMYRYNNILIILLLYRFINSVMVEETEKFPLFLDG